MPQQFAIGPSFAACGDTQAALRIWVLKGCDLLFAEVLTGGAKGPNLFAEAAPAPRVLRDLGLEPAYQALFAP